MIPLRLTLPVLVVFSTPPFVLHGYECVPVCLGFLACYEMTRNDGQDVILHHVNGLPSGNHPTPASPPHTTLCLSSRATQDFLLKGVFGVERVRLSIKKHRKGLRSSVQPMWGSGLSRCRHGAPVQWVVLRGNSRFAAEVKRVVPKRTAENCKDPWRGSTIFSDYGAKAPLWRTAENQTYPSQRPRRSRCAWCEPTPNRDTKG